MQAVPGGLAPAASEGGSGMSEQRLIDGNDLFGIVSLLYDSARRTSRECEYFVGQILFDIKQQPTIEVVPVVRGKWIDEGSYVITAYGQLDIRKCSNCNEDITIDDHDSFCPSCGADMSKE